MIDCEIMPVDPVLGLRGQFWKLIHLVLLPHKARPKLNFEDLSCYEYLWKNLFVSIW